MVRVAAGQQPGVWIFGVRVVKMDQSLAGADRFPEQVGQRAAITREVAKRALIVGLPVHLVT